MITYYLTQTQRLLQNPGAPTTLYSTSDLTSYINTMRGQLAGEGECIHLVGTITTVIGQREYFFSNIAVSGAGVQGVLHVRRIQYAVGTGYKWITPRGWEWFELYGLNNPVPLNNVPKMWAQHSQGSSGLGTITNVGGGSIASGSFWLDPPPDLNYQLNLDCICYPIALASDSDPEAIPYEWTDAVPFGAAWMALLSAQTSARMAEAEKYLSYFQAYAQKARQYSNPDVLKYQYMQQPNIALPGQLGVSMGKGGQ